MIKEENSLCFPQKHKEIVDVLLNGNFVVNGEELYEDICKNVKYYDEFFIMSFGSNLVHKNELFYLASPDSKGEVSDKITLMLLIYINEIEISGKGILDTLMSRNSIQNFIATIKDSTYSEKLKNIDIESMLQECNNRNLVTFIDEDDFAFTESVNVFLGHTIEMAHVEKR